MANCLIQAALQSLVGQDVAVKYHPWDGRGGLRRQSIKVTGKVKSIDYLGKFIQIVVVDTDGCEHDIDSDQDLVIKAV